jgi:hypothetical protein
MRLQRLSVEGQTHVSPCRCCSPPSPMAGKTARMISESMGHVELYKTATRRWHAVVLEVGGDSLWRREVRASAGICQSKSVRHRLILPYAGSTAMVCSCWHAL